MTALWRCGEIAGAGETMEEAVPSESQTAPASVVGGVPGSAAPAADPEPEAEDDDGWVEIVPR